MSPADKDLPVGLQTAPKPVAPTNPGSPPPTGSIPVEPMPSEGRRLPKADARPAPVVPLLRARWPWLIVAALLGTVLGLVLGGTPTYEGTAQLRLTGISDPNQVKTVAQTYENTITSDPVLAIAAKTVPGVTEDELSTKVKAKYITDTSLIEVTAQDADSQRAANMATGVAQAVVDYANQQRQDQLKSILTQYGDLLNKNQLTNNVAEQARQGAIGSAAANAQTGAVSDASSISLVSKLATVGLAGTSRPISAGLGGVGGLILGALVALGAGAGRRRLRSPNELKALAPELNLRSTTQAGEVAGRLLESGHSTLVVLSLPSTPSSASRFAAAVANHLRTHGSSVTLVNAIALESGDSSSMALPDEVWVLRRDIRQDVKAYFSTDVLVVACTAEPEAVGLISGQSDLMAVVVAKEGRSTLQQVWDAVSAVETADPIVVLAP